MSTTFEWRANDSDDDTPRLDTTQGCVFTVPATAVSSPNPPLTLVPTRTSGSVQQNNDQGKTASLAAGDDDSPPNSVNATKLNAIAVPVSASAGWCTSPTKPEGVYPSDIFYDLRLKSGSSGRKEDDSLELIVTLEYSNPRFDVIEEHHIESGKQDERKGGENGESMMVKVAVAKTVVNEETKSELALVATQFQEYVVDKDDWVDITADIDYTQTAEQVVDAVLQDPTAGQTAGKATVTAETVDLTLGPFSKKARLILTFQADSLYTYEAMSTSATSTADIGAYRLLPLCVTLPFAPIHHEAGLSSLSVRLSTPTGTGIMSVEQNPDAYWHLKDQDIMKATTILTVPELVTQQQEQEGTSNPEATAVGYHLSWSSLPPRSCGILAWLKRPNDAAYEEPDDFAHILASDLEQLHVSTATETMTVTTTNVPSAMDEDNGALHAKAVIQVPTLAADMTCLQVPLPGHGPMGSLYRIHVQIPKTRPPHRENPYFILNLTLSDKSGSTSRRLENGGTTMRQCFNELAEMRFLKRLESIPALVQAGVLQLYDYWMDAFVAFDHKNVTTSAISRVCFQIQDVVDSIQAVVQSIRSDDVQAQRLSSPFFTDIHGHVHAIRGVLPSGGTNFSVGPEAILNGYEQWMVQIQTAAHTSSAAASSSSSSNNFIPCTFLEFDTDGGHNGSSTAYLDHLQELRRVCHVRDAIVTGFGTWLNQDCASKVARVLGCSMPAQLALYVPERGSEGLHQIFRRGFSAWIRALRQPAPLTMKLSAGSVSFPSATSTRTCVANAVEVLAIRRQRLGGGGDGDWCSEPLPKFGLPDVSKETYTKSVIENIPAGDALIFYIISRLQSATQLASALEIETTTTFATTAATTTNKESSGKVVVSVESESLTGSFLAFDFLKILTSKKGNKRFQLSPLAATSLWSRLEDEVSFRFNIASPSGSTSYLGRCKTVPNRAAIDAAHQPPVPVSPIHFVFAADDSEWLIIRHKQQRLLLLRHASRCQHEAGKCPVTPHCASMKKLWEHIAHCENQQCTVQYCLSSRYVLSHYRRCEEARCPTCGPVRETIRKSHEPEKSCSPTNESGHLFDAMSNAQRQRPPLQPPLPGLSSSCGDESFAQSSPMSPSTAELERKHTKTEHAPSIPPAYMDNSMSSIPPANASSSSAPRLQRSERLAASSPFSNKTTESWSNKLKTTAYYDIGAVAPASASSSFGVAAPAPAIAGSPFGAYSTTRATPASAGTRPMWANTMVIPVGAVAPAEKQNYDALKRAMTEVTHARQRLLGDPKIAFICDICNRTFEQGEDRFHCFDCNDFDLCFNCRDGHTLPFHRVFKVTSDAPNRKRQYESIAPEDPLVANLLQPAPGTVTQAQTAEVRPQIDQCEVWNRRKIHRFLLSVLNWWPLFRSTCVFCDRLPLTIPDDLAQKISRCCTSSNDGGSLDELLNTTTIIIDSIMRADNEAEKSE